MRQFRFAAVYILITVALLACDRVQLQAQMFGIPPASSDSTAWKDISGLVADEEPIACFIWNEAGPLNPGGNKSEQWYADKGLQTSLGALKKAIVALAMQQDNPLMARFAKDVGWKLVSKAGFVELEHIDPVRQTGIGTVVVRLGEDRALITDFLDDLMAEMEMEPEAEGRDRAYVLPETPIPIVVGVYNGHLVLAVGEGQWQRITDRIDGGSGAPEWLSTRLSAVPIDRRSQFAFASVKGMMELLPPEAIENEIFERVREKLALDAIKSVMLTTGTDSISNIGMVHLECDKEGLASVMDVPEIESAILKEFPLDSISAIAIRFAPQKVMSLFEETVPPDMFEQAMIQFAEVSNLDLQTDIVDHLEGTLRTYQTGSIINPKQMGIIRIKDEQKFQESYKKINETLEGIAASRNLEFYEKEKNGVRTYGIKNYGISGYWAVHKGNLYISTNSRAIGSHIRKAAELDRESVLDTELAEQVMKDAKSMGFGGPIMMQHYDLDQVIEVAVPALQTAMNFMPPEARSNFDFGPDDVPSVESLTGLRCTHSMLFKSPGGYTGIARYDTPVNMELSTVAASGIGVGMLLPAVQAAREAARRTSSMNNQRQLVLALLNYESTNGHFPPAYTVDEGGTPLLSWRVEILPYLGQKELYEQFNHDEPWDSDHNMELLEQMPLLFSNPSVANRPGWTVYVAPISDDSVLRAGGGTEFKKITDGSSNTVLVMEVGESQQVPWTAPQDIEIESLEDLRFDNGHPGVTLFAMCDGSVRSIASSTPIEGFIKACKKSDGVGMEQVGQ